MLRIRYDPHHLILLFLAISNSFLIAFGAIAFIEYTLERTVRPAQSNSFKTKEKNIAFTHLHDIGYCMIPWTAAQHGTQTMNYILRLFQNCVFFETVHPSNHNAVYASAGTKLLLRPTPFLIFSLAHLRRSLSQSCEQTNHRTTPVPALPSTHCTASITYSCMTIRDHTVAPLLLFSSIFFRSSPIPVGIFRLLPYLNCHHFPHSPAPRVPVFPSSDVRLLLLIHYHHNHPVRNTCPRPPFRLLRRNLRINPLRQTP